MTRPRELCALLSDWKGHTPTGGTWHEVKQDGWRAIRFPGIDGKVRLWTRNGHEIHGAAHILHRLDRMEREAGEAMVFDGEFVVDGSLAATKAWCESGYKFGGEAGVLHLFDAIPLARWREGLDPTPLYRRRERLEALVTATSEPEWEWRAGSRGRDDDTLSVVLVEQGWASDAYDVARQARLVWRAGGEGIVTKDAEAGYERRRVTHWAKVKRENQHKWSRAASALNREFA